MENRSFGSANQSYNITAAGRGAIGSAFAELDASVLEQTSGRQAGQKPTAVQTGSARANYYRKGSKSDSSGCLQRRGTAAGVQARLPGCGTEQQPRIYRVRASDDDQLTRPETLSGNAMRKKLTTTPWRTEDARSGLASPRRSRTLPFIINPAG